jgi:hypothetical protein
MFKKLPDLHHFAGAESYPLRLIHTHTHTHHAVPQPCYFLPESRRVSGKFRTANRETPRGSRKKSNQSKSLATRHVMVCVN